MACLKFVGRNYKLLYFLGT